MRSRWPMVVAALVAATVGARAGDDDALLDALTDGPVCPTPDRCWPREVSRALHARDAEGVRLPARAASLLYLRVAPASQLEMDVTTFGTPLTVTLVAEDGRERVLHGDSFPPAEAGTITLDLAPWAGQLVLLRFLPAARAPRDYPHVLVRRLTLRPRPTDASASRSSPPSERLNVVVYLIDALRADHLGCYGYDRPTSPRIDQFAHSGLLFSDAVAQSSWTLPSTASILTGRTPRRHGAMAVDMAIRPDVATLAERFRGAGYRTAAFVTNYLVSTEYGLARGFDHFRLYREEAGRRAAVYLPSAALRRRVRRWLEREVDQGPFFLYVHATDPHWPYLPAARHARPFRAAAMTDAEERRVVDASRSFFFGNEHHMERPTSMPASRVAVLRDLYDGDVRAADEGFGRLLDDLAALGLLEHTVVVLTADHGEEFRDHDGLGHGQTLHREVLHVPLVVRLPGGARGGERIARTVQHVDIAPTVLDLAGIDRSDDLEGRSLLDDAPPDVPVVLSQLDNLGFVFDGVTTPRLKAIRSLSDPTPGLAPITVYDREQDPDERRDVARMHPVFAGYARQQLRAAVATVRPGPPVPPDKLERLRALGYVEP